MRRALYFILPIAALGCLDPDEPSHSFFRPPAPTALPPMTAASTEAAARVDTMGRKLLAANPQIGAQPLFRTIGAPQPEVFHRGTTDLFVTEGLVTKCDDAQLAAVLCMELGKMVREREAATPNTIRTREPLPPIDSRLGSDDRMGGTADRTDLKEYVKFDASRKARRGAPILPEPQLLAIDYLTKAGFNPASLAAADPVLKVAAAETGLERQITTATAVPPTY